MNDTVKIMKKKAHKLVNDTAKRVNSATDSAENAMHNTMSTMREKACDMQDYATSNYESLADYVTKRPVKALVIAAAVGGLIAMCCNKR